MGVGLTTSYPQKLMVMRLGKLDICGHMRIWKGRWKCKLWYLSQIICQQIYIKTHRLRQWLRCCSCTYQKKRNVPLRWENDDRPTRLWTHRGVRLWTHHDYGHTIFSRLWTHLLFSNTLSLFIIILFEFEFFYKLNKKNTTTTTKFIFLHESAKR